MLLGLMKTDEKYRQVYDFLRNDFSQERWRGAAMKNAFRALGQKKLEVACAFFLLGTR